MALQPAMIDAAITAGATHFYPSEWNSDISQPAIRNMRYFRDKQTVRAHLATRAKATPGFTYTLFVTGIFTEWATLAFYGFDHAAATAAIYGTPDARVGVTSIPDVARYTVASLLLRPPVPATDPANAAGRTIRVQGDALPFRDLVAALGKARGTSYQATYLDPAVAAAKEDEARRGGDEVGEIMWSIRPLVASGFGVAVADADGRGLDNRLFGFRPETVEETFRRVYAGTSS